MQLVVAVSGDPPATSLLRDFKAYASRALNVDRGYRRRWWTRSGVTKPLRNEGQVLAAMRQVCALPDALARIEDTGEPGADAEGTDGAEGTGGTDTRAPHDAGRSGAGDGAGAPAARG